MTITQTVEIPADRRIKLDLDVPPQIPTGDMARVELIWFPQNKKADEYKTALEEIRAICKDLPISVDSFLEDRRKEKELEDEKYRRLYSDFTEDREKKNPALFLMRFTKCL
jgi:hypothetical protein